MSSNYSANQYEGSYRSQRLQNGGVAKPCRERPSALEGHSSTIADDRGHLIPGAVKRGTAWPDFQGTWDLRAQLHPPRRVNPTGRSAGGLDRLRAPRADPTRTGADPPEEGGRGGPPPEESGRGALPSEESGRGALPSEESGRGALPSDQVDHEEGQDRTSAAAERTTPPTTLAPAVRD